MTTVRLTWILPIVVAGLLLTAAPATAETNAPGTSVVVKPTAFFAKACMGDQQGLAKETGAAYRCVNGQWVREDLPVCPANPPLGVCSGNGACQVPSARSLYLCNGGSWRSLSTMGGPGYATDRAIARFDGTSGRLLANSPATISDQGILSAPSAVPSNPLAVSSGGTGISDAGSALLVLGAANDAAVVHIAGDETIQGNKTLTGATATSRLNEARHSEAFPDIASAIADLPSTGGVLEIDGGEDDPTAFPDANPASSTAGKKNALVVDARNGGIRFLSSMPEYPSGAAGSLEDRVPFVFQVRLNDPSHVYDDLPGAIGAWNCGRVIPGANDAWRNCPYSSTSWGIQGGSKQFWHSGQCNMLLATDGGSSDICSGPHIFEVRYPEQPGVHESKPIFAVGNGGAAIYSPESRTQYWRGYLTMFRGDDGLGDPLEANAPMFSFEKFGAFFDGGLFAGSTLAWPTHTMHTYPQYKFWIRHDRASTDPAFVVESSGNSGAAHEQGVLGRIYDKTCCGGTEHRFGQPNSAREAFGFYANSVLRLASFTTSTGIERGQYIEWEGFVIDANTTRLRVIEPTGPRDIYLPDRSGTVPVAPNSATSGPLMAGISSDGNTVCRSAGLSCQSTIENQGSAGGHPCDFAYPSSFLAMCRGSN